MTNDLRHGGDTDAASAFFGIADTDWLDLSTGINPVPYPIRDVPADVWQRLPTKSDARRLEEAARVYYGANEAGALCIAPGTQAIIQWLPRLRPRSRVHVLGPTYEEHAARWRAGGHNVENINEISAADADVLILVNPNNPDGRVVSANTLVDLAAHQANRNGLLIVDEAFADVAPPASVTRHAGRAGLLVLRSFGKFFGLAGMRLGFAFGSEMEIAPLSDALGLWAVPGPALTVGADAFADTAWQKDTRARLIADAARMDTLLIDAGLKIVGGTTLFRLACGRNAPEIYERLGRAAILTRKFDHRPDWLRFGLPGTDAGWQRLEQALK